MRSIALKRLTNDNALHINYDAKASRKLEHR